ncbi:hypothetical protein BGZ60DRAFT_397431 [Tricladium varicosporioides]|nr:hypothetical protein BGZ60DRAFT_397431 [Hymenoscyphus varicosporioides]
MTSPENKSTDWVAIKSPVRQQQKRGRPPIQSTSDSVSAGDENVERTRLAQRAYRNRKDMKVDGLKARVARLEYALEQTIKSFTRFQNLAIEVENLPPKIALEISRTALDMALITQKAHSGGSFQNMIPDNSGPEKLLKSQDTADDIPEERIAREVQPTERAQISSPGNPLTTPVPKIDFTSFDLAKTTPPIGLSTTILTQHNLAPRAPEAGQRKSFAEKLLQLCLERGVQLLTSPTMTYDDLHPALSIHLTWVTVEELRVQSVRAMANNFEHLQEDAEPSVTLLYPDMYRSIEGSDGLIVPRVPKLEPQQLVHGRTRTKLGTNLHDFKGEWLEPIDVQEYLEWKGIFLGSSGLDRVLQISIPEATIIDIWTQDGDAIFTEEIQRSRIMSNSWLFSPESQGLELQGLEPKVSDEVLIQPAESQVPTLVRQNDSVAASNPGRSIFAPQAYQTQTNAAQYNLSNEFYPLGHVEQLISVTLHLDRLRKLLVGAACCIGPGPGIRREAVEHAIRLSIATY